MSKLWSEQDTRYMARAMQLARQGWCSTHPNPRVGCVLVKDDQIVGEGFHERAGTAHAEVHALKQAGDAAHGATAYVTLEPCSHHGKTPPCADALIQAGVARVVAAMTDPNPQVAGAGLQRIAEAGISVESGLLEQDAEALNPGFIKRMQKKQPFVRLKMAMSLDGRTSMASGESQWITGPDARADVQKLRAGASAVLTGSGTALHDNPRLTVRDEALLAQRQSQPVRVVLDKTAALSGNEALFNKDAQVLYFYGASTTLNTALSSKAHVDCVTLPLNESGYFDLSVLLTILAEREMNEVLVECGSGLAGAFIEQSCVDELIIFMAPQLMGSAARPLADFAVEHMAQAKHLDLVDTRMVGKDIKLTYRFL